MAILESKFIRDNPQLRREVEEEMKFSNLVQQEAESKVARKHNLKHPSTSRSSQGRWIKMLKTKKMAGPVTAGHAGIESKPRYSRKKKKEDLKKAKPSVKKKRLIRVGNLMVNQETGDEMDTVQRAYLDWKSECQVGLAEIGVTGRGSDKDGNKGNDTLFEHVRDHVIPRVQRVGASPKDGAKDTIATLDRLILHEDSLIGEDEEDILKEFMDDIKAMAGGNEDPRNINFTQPLEVVPRGEGANRKFVDVGKDEVFGHYRTPIYVDSRKKVHGSENELGAVKAGWYSSEKNSAEPPFWQAIYSKSSLSGEEGDTVTIGLLGILENFEKALDDTYLKELIINDTGDFGAKINSLGNLTRLKSKLLTLMKDKKIYRGGGHQVKYGGATGIKTLLNATTFKVTDTQTSKYLTEIAPQLKDITGGDDVKEFKIKFTDATINRMINLFVRPEFVVPPHLGSNGKPFLLSDAGGGRKVKGQPWSTAYQTALDKSKIKKSWYDGLWGQKIVKKEPVRIHFLSDKKLMAWISDEYGSGRGPYTIESIYAQLKRDGTFEDRMEFIDDKRIR